MMAFQDHRNGLGVGGRACVVFLLVLVQLYRSVESFSPKLLQTVPISSTLSVPSIVGFSDQRSSCWSSLQDANRQHPKSTSETIRDELRKLTGFSLTAIRITLRTATGISLTAIYASTLAVTGAWIRQTMKVIFGIFPAWFRYFLQPFLVLYYAPLFILRNLTGPTRQRARKTHEYFVEGWKEAVETADTKSSYWPIHLRGDGSLEKDFDELDLSDAVAESVAVALEEQERPR